MLLGRHTNVIRQVGRHIRCFSILSQDQVAQFHEDGFLLIEDFCKNEEIEELKTRAIKLMNEYKVPEFDKKVTFDTVNQHEHKEDFFLNSAENISFFLESDAYDTDQQTLRQEKVHSINKFGHAMHLLDPIFNKFSLKNKAYGDIAYQLGFTNAVLPQTMYICKPPKIGGFVGPHKDNEFLLTNPYSTLGFWFAVDDATQENGCLWGLQGSHKIAPRKIFVKKADGTGTEWRSMNPNETVDDILKEEEEEFKRDESKYVPVEAKKGSMVLLHGNALHFSYANISGKTRHAYTMHTVNGMLPWMKDNWLQNRAINNEFPLLASSSY